MTRVLSGVVLGIAALALIWFLSSTALLLVALVVAAIAFHEYERIVDKIGAKVPYWTALLATLLACSMVPFQWVDIESILAASLLLIALNVLLSDRVGAPLLADTAAAMMATISQGGPKKRAATSRGSATAAVARRRRSSLPGPPLKRA